MDEQTKIFLGGDCSDGNEWRTKITKQYNDGCVSFIDPYDPNWKAEENIYQEISDMINSDLVLFYKGGEGTDKEKQLLKDIDIDFQEFDDLDTLMTFLAEVEEDPDSVLDGKDSSTTEANDQTGGSTPYAINYTLQSKHSSAIAKDLHTLFQTLSSITLPIEEGDEILTGHWKNHKEKVKSIGEDKYGQPTINDRPLLNIRIPTLMGKDKTKKDSSIIASILKLEDSSSAVAQSQTDTPEFKAWFGDSKVVDEDGEPLVVYHGTQATFKIFEGERQGESVSGRGGDVGYFFTNDPEVASAHAVANWWRDNPTPNVMPVYLSLKNPEIIDDVGEPSRWYDTYGRITALNAISEGKDGVIIGSSIKLYIVFSNMQIKSAIGNKGAFDPQNPDITATKKDSSATVASVFERTAVYHGTTEALGKKIQADGFLRPAKDSGIDQWSGGLFGGNPSNPDLVYATIDEDKARDYAKQICNHRHTSKAALITLEPNWSAVVPDEDVVADYLMGNADANSPLSEKIWKAYAKYKGFKSVKEAQEFDPTFDGEVDLPSDSQTAEDMKETVMILFPMLTDVEVEELIQETAAFSKPLKVINVEFFIIGGAQAVKESSATATIQTVMAALKYEHGCIEIPVPVHISSYFLKEILTERLFMEDLNQDESVFGIETDTHITCLYGTDDQDKAVAELKKLFTKPLHIKTSDVEYFDNDDSSVAYISLECPELTEMHYALAKNLDVKDTHPEYTPHITLAYLNKGKRLKDDKVKSFEWDCSTIFVSSKDGHLVSVNCTPDLNGDVLVQELIDPTTEQ